jgi:hypothetical protein
MDPELRDFYADKSTEFMRAVPRDEEPKMELAQGYRDLPSGNVGFYENGVLTSTLDPQAEYDDARAELEAERRNERYWEERGAEQGVPLWAQ